MKLVLFQKPAASDVVPGVLTERGVVSIADVVPSRHTPQLTMQGIIDAFDAVRPALERCAPRCPGLERSWRASRTTGSTAPWSRGR